MRPVQLRLLAVAGVLAVAIGAVTAIVAGRGDAGAAQPAAVAAPTTSTARVLGDDPGSTPTTADPPGRPTPGPARAAETAAVAFLRELGMRDPVAASYRKTGPATAEVGIHPRTGEGDRPLDQVTTLVRLHRYTNGWVVTEARAFDIQVGEPLPFSRIRSPVSVFGRSETYEGTVHVTVTEDRRGPDRVLGKGFVTGGGGPAEMARFSGAITFPRPTADAGWVIFADDTGSDSGILSASAVRVRLAAQPAQVEIHSVSTDPRPSASARLVTLTGSGTLKVEVSATGARAVRFLLVPSGTGGRPQAKVLGSDTRPDGDSLWHLAWKYPDEAFTGHLLVQASGPGGDAENDRIAVYHA